MSYAIKEIFSSIQGEGCRAGVPSIFVRFAGCNMACRVSTHGFDCDTDFAGGGRMDLAQLEEEIGRLSYGHTSVILTGGEPGLQVDAALVDRLHACGWFVAIETNGTIALPPGIDWITVSPKTPEHTLRQRTAHETKYVLAAGQPLPRRPSIEKAPDGSWATRLLSPAFKCEAVDPDALAWCIKLCRENPEWRLSVQQHKGWGIR